MKSAAGIVIFLTIGCHAVYSDEMTATVKNNKACKFVQDVYPLKKYSPHKAFALSIDGKHCGYAYGMETREAAKKAALEDCIKVSSTKCNLLRLD